MKNLFLIVIILTAMMANAQHSITLTDGNVLKGKITAVQPNYITIVDSIHKTDCPIGRILNYDAGNGIVVVTDKMVKPSVVAPTTSTTQNYRYSQPSAGDELIKASNIYYTGLAIMIGGSTLSVVGSVSSASSNNQNEANPLVYVGAGITLVGAIIQVTAFSHIGKAGRKLNLISTQNGLGLAYRF